MDIFCQTCQQIICARCIVNKHKSHDFHELSQVVSKLKAQVQQALLQTQTSHDEVMKGIVQVEKRMEDIRRQEDDIINRVQKIFSDIRSKVNEREAALLHQVKSLSSQHLLTLQSQLESLKKVATSAERQVQATTTCVKCYCSHSLVFYKQQMMFNLPLL